MRLIWAVKISIIKSYLFSWILKKLNPLHQERQLATITEEPKLQRIEIATDSMPLLKIEAVQILARQESEKLAILAILPWNNTLDGSWMYENID